MKTQISRFRIGQVSAWILIILLILANSCAPGYVPNKTNNPMFSRKGDIKASASLGLSGFDPQLAYAVTDHIGIMANGSFSTSESDTGEDYHKHWFGEAGLGYYGAKNAFRYEIYGGYGYGKTEGYFENNLVQRVNDSKVHRLFIQPAIGIGSNVFDGNLATRFSMIKLKGTDDQYSDEEEKFRLFIEPTLSGSLGYKYVKFITQLGVSVPTDDANYFDHRPLIFSVGLVFHLNTRKKKESTGIQ